MKFILTSLCLLLMSSTWANTTDIRNFLFDGSEVSKVLNLSTEASRIEHRRVLVRSTCYRHEVRRECQSSGRNGEVQCRNVTRTVPYSCDRFESRPFEVFDRYVETSVRFEFNNSELTDKIAENFVVKVTGNRPELSVNSSKNYIIVLDKKEISTQIINGKEIVDVLYKVNFIPAKGSASVLENGIQNVKLKSGVLTFNFGTGFNLENFSQQVRIYKNKRLGRDKLLLDKLLVANELNIQDTGNTSLITIDLKKLGISLPSKMRVILNTAYRGVDSMQVLNSSDVSTTASANWIFR